MKNMISAQLITLSVLLFAASNGICNEPDPDTPWPVAFSTGGMGISRTLMNSYGDLNGSWSLSLFHTGIDIDATTGEPDCNEVRCVDNGYVTAISSSHIPGTEDEYQWVLIICDEEGGTAENGWSYGHLMDIPSAVEVGYYFSQGEFIGCMHDSVSVPHLHFMWTSWDDTDFSKCNPMKYLDPDPLFEEGYTWQFNPESLNPPHRYFFLPDAPYSDWDDYSIVDYLSMMMNSDELFGNVDFFFGVGLRGDGMTGGVGEGRNEIAPQKIKWDVVRECPGGEQILDTKYVVDFDCWLSCEEGADTRAKMLYFVYSLDQLFEYNALLFCLSNCVDADDWDGINTIDELSWNTDADFEGSGSTLNPVLALLQDGPYRLDVTYYSFDEDYTYPVSIDCELHNFHPAVEEVIVSGSSGEIYHAQWTTTGFTVITDQPVGNDETLDVEVIFTEPMNTSAVVTAGLDSPYDQISANETRLEFQQLS